MAKLVVLIAGNICSGKSSLIRYIDENKKKFDRFLGPGEELITVPESIDPPALELFYEGLERFHRSGERANNYNFEKSCLDGRITRYFKAKYGSSIYIFDRGMIEGAETFCKNSWQEGHVTHHEYSIYLENLKKGLDDLERTKQKKWLERLIVYLQIKDTDIKTLEERNKKRQTKGEEIPPGYLKELNLLYEEFFRNAGIIYPEKYAVKAPQILTVDASVDFNLNPNFLPDTLERIINKIKEIKNVK